MVEDLKDYKVLGVLGKGSYGTCYKVVKRQTNETYALKAMDYGLIPDDKKQLIVSEVNLLSQLSHPNIVQYYGRILNKETTTLYIIMECCDGGDLATLIERCKKEHNFLEEGFVWRVLYQTGRALQACHSHFSRKTVLHRDIKPANVFLDLEGNVKVGDFGLARILDSGVNLAQSMVGTLYYMSPELISKEKYNQKSDIWSLGCLVYEICSLSRPFDGFHHLETLDRIREGKFSRIPIHFSDDLQNIISFLLTVKQDARPNIETVLYHPTVVTNLVSCTFENLICKEKVNDKEKSDTNSKKIVSRVKPYHHSKPHVEDLQTILQTKLEALKQRESSIREKEIKLEERARSLDKREKDVALLDRVVKEKMLRANVYLNQCRDSRSTTTSGKYSSKRHSLVGPTLSNIDSSFSADPGDTSIAPTSSKLKPSCVQRPQLFNLPQEKERRVHFSTLPKKDTSVHSQNKSSEVASHTLKSRKPLEIAVRNDQHNLEQIDEATEQNFRNCVLAKFKNEKRGDTASFSQERSVWLENKRLAYKNPISHQPEIIANKENNSVLLNKTTTKKKLLPSQSSTPAKYYNATSGTLMNHFR